MTAQNSHPVKPLVTIKDVRDALKPLIPSDPFIATLDKQLKGWAKGENHEHLRPRIEETIARIERARAL